MKFNYKEKNKFKHIRTNMFEIPTDELEKPLTNGREVFEFLLQHANKERYAFKGRGRGSRKVHGRGYFRDLPLEHSEKIALYVDQRWHISQKEKEERRRSKSATDITWKFKNLIKQINEHNEEFDNDLEIEIKE